MKGLFEFILVMIVLVVAAIVIVFGHLFLVSFKTAVNGTLNQTSIDIIDKGIVAEQTYDTMFGFLTVGLFMAVIISGLYIRSHPLFFVISIFLLAIIVMISGTFTNLYYEFAQNSAISNTATSYPLIAQIFSNLPIIISIMGIAAMIIWYARSRGGDGTV